MFGSCWMQQSVKSIKKKDVKKREKDKRWSVVRVEMRS